MPVEVIEEPRDELPKMFDSKPQGYGTGASGLGNQSTRPLKQLFEKGASYGPVKWLKERR